MRACRYEQDERARTRPWACSSRSLALTRPSPVNHFHSVAPEKYGTRSLGMMSVYSRPAAFDPSAPRIRSTKREARKGTD